MKKPFSKISISISVCFGFTLSLLAQPINNIVKNVTQPSPIATAFGKFSDIPVSLGSGLANISIPIHTIQEGPLTLPISLSYHSSGVKVGELASWVGQNWNLNTGGIISRTVLGIPDESGNGYWLTGTTYDSTQGNGQHYQDIYNGQLDGEPDIFSYTAGNYSGKFFVDRYHNIRLMPYQDLKIEMVGVMQGFIIKLPDGTRYIFGKIPGSSTATYDQSKSTNEVSYVVTSFHLLRIETHDQKYQINFNYTDEYYGYKTLASCRYQIVSNCNDAPTWDCSGSGSYDAYHEFVTTEVNAYRISSITYSTGSINFIADTVRDDLDQHNGNNNRARRLDRIEVNSSTFCKRFNLFYSYFEDNNYASSRSEAKKLKLNRVRESSCNQSLILPDYILEYEGPIVGGKQWLPHRLHKGVDHWGFYNGATGNETILINVPPTTLHIVNYDVVYGTADRESNYTYMVYGALKKITYPTGGSTAFVYEGNTIYTLTQGTPSAVFTLTNCPSPLSQSCCGTTVTSAFRTLTSTELSTGSYKLHLVQTQGTTCSSATNISILLKVFNGAIQVGSAAFNISSGSQIITGSLSSIGVTSSSINYKYEITVTDGYGKFEIISTPSVYANKVVGGLRIKEIRTNDGINGSSLDIVKTYDYFDESTPSQSSGVILSPIKYTYVIPAIGGVGLNVWTAETVVPNGGYEGYHVGYRKVRENHNGNGKSIYAYNQLPDSSSYLVYPIPPPYGDVQSGTLISKADYNSSNALIRKDEYTYTTYTFYNTPDQTIYKVMDFICQGDFDPPPPPPYPHTYWATSYIIGVKAALTLTTTTTLDGVVTTTTNEYDFSKRHISPIASYFTNSDGLTTRSEMKFPFDMSAGAVKDTLIKRNLLVAWESIKKVNNLQVDGERTNFGLYSTTGYTTYQGPVANGGNPYPSNAQRYEMTWVGGSPQAGNWVTKGTFDNYDLAGNPRQFTKSNWPQETYEWQNGQIKKRTYQNFIWEYTYFNNNTRLLTSTKNVDGQIINYTYDAMMRLSTANARAGNVVTTYTYGYKDVSNTYNKITASTAFTAVSGSSLTNKTDVQYFDGLGRLVETVKKAHSPASKDVALAITYDNTGRVSREYIPYEGTLATGAFITVPGGHPNTYTQYEASPLNRPSSVTPPSWYATSFSYGTNTSNEVNLNGGASFYASGTINKETSTDAQGNISNTYKDKKGLMVMSRMVNSLDAKTLYDYDDKDRLIMVVPPGATSASTGLIFTYAYDAADRMTQKKVPDANAVNMTYNVRDLLAFVQDGNLAAQSKYLATQYDDYGRVTKSGFSTSTANPSAPTFSEVLAENFYDGHDGVSQVINLTTNPQYRGKIYKSKTKVLGSSNDWISKVHTYDTHGRTTNTTGNNHLTLASSNTEVFNLTYDWADNLLTENRSHSNGTALTFNQRRGFEHQGRLYDYFVNIAGTEKHTARYGYNARNELTERNIHYDTYGGTGAWLQSVDYTYNDQGWLTTINSPTLGGTNIAFPTCTSSVVNPGTTTVGQDIDTKDLFYMQLQYDILHTGLSGTLRKDGNISQAVWRVRGRQRQAYAYSYDGLQRISTATYSDINDAGTVTASNRYNTSYTYADLRGNISNLQRNGLYLNGACYTQALMDNLTYSHTSGTNKISTISDAAMSTQGGFRAASGGFTYDANGNMLTNGAKGITSISYNHFNLPTNITITGGKTIDFTYAADGTKLRKVVKTGATINLVMEYVNGIEYRGTAIPATTLEAVYFSEGRMYSSSGTWKREYVIRDHLGNTRIAYSDINGDGVIAVPGEILQENNYDAFGYGLDGVYMNHANADNLYQYNGKEKNDDHGLNWFDYGARWYDAGIGRFSTIDRFSDKYFSISPFQYGSNNPIRYIDFNGDSIIQVNINDESGYIHGNSEIFIDHTIYEDVQSILIAAAETETHIKINSSFRTNKKQEELNGDSNATTPAKPGKSGHNAGVAFDFNVYTDNEETKGIDNGNSTLNGENSFISKVKEISGWRWGGDFSSPDKIHLDKKNEDFENIRDANQKQMNGDNTTSIDKTKINRIESFTINKKLN